MNKQEKQILQALKSGAQAITQMDGMSGEEFTAFATTLKINGFVEVSARSDGLGIVVDSITTAGRNELQKNSGLTNIRLIRA